MWIYIAHCHKVSNALGTLVPAKKPSFQTVSEGLIVLLCTEVVRQGFPDHGAVHSECSSANSMQSATIHCQVQYKNRFDTTTATLRRVYRVVLVIIK